MWTLLNRHSLLLLAAVLGALTGGLVGRPPWRGRLIGAVLAPGALLGLSLWRRRLEPAGLAGLAAGQPVLLFFAADL